MKIKLILFFFITFASLDDKSSDESVLCPEGSLSPSCMNPANNKAAPPTKEPREKGKKGSSGKMDDRNSGTYSATDGGAALNIGATLHTEDQLGPTVLPVKADRGSGKGKQGAGSPASLDEQPPIVGRTSSGSSSKGEGKSKGKGKGKSKGKSMDMAAEWDRWGPRYDSPYPKDPSMKRLIVFDFDQTVSVCHVFKTLSGWMSGENLGISELGQMRRLAEIDQDYPEGFAIACMGGQERIDQLDKMFATLTANKVELMVCSKGLVGPIRKILTEVNLINHFTQVYANTGVDYGESPYDVNVREKGLVPKKEQDEYMINGAYAMYGGKEFLMQALLEARGLKKEHGLLVEDDKMEIDKALRYCQTLHIDPPTGMTPAHMAKVVQMMSPPKDSGYGGAHSEL